jgi:hypothetical protein
LVSPGDTFGDEDMLATASHVFNLALVYCSATAMAGWRDGAESRVKLHIHLSA